MIIKIAYQIIKLIHNHTLVKPNRGYVISYDKNLPKWSEQENIQNSDEFDSSMTLLYRKGNSQ